MYAIISEFSFTVNGKTRDETLAKLDEFGLMFLEGAGGAPWLMVDDDVQRMHMPQWVMSDDQGFAYIGKRTYKFGGPALPGPGTPVHDNFKMQRGVLDE